MIIHKHFLSIGECIVAESRECEFVTSRDGYKEAVANINLNVRNSLSWPLPDKFVEYLEQRLADEIIPLLVNTCDPLSLSEVHGVTYTKDGFFSAHRDNVNNGRRFTGIVLLSSPSEFRGGTLYIELDGEFRPIPLRKGDLYLFPSGDLHYVSRVDHGARKVIVFWLH